MNSNVHQLRAMMLAMVMLCEANALAAVSSFCPIACATLTSVPTLFSSERELDIHVSMPTAPMAATASLPSRPTHAMSVRL